MTTCSTISRFGVDTPNPTKKNLAIEAGRATLRSPALTAKMQSAPNRWARRTRPSALHRLGFRWIQVQCSDVATSAAFYDKVLAPLGGKRIIEYGDVLGYEIPPMPDFWLGPRATGEGFRESHIAFTAPDRTSVRAFLAAAVAQGAEVLHDARVWPEYHPGYGAFVRDPDANNVEAVCQPPE